MRGTYIDIGLYTKITEKTHYWQIGCLIDQVINVEFPLLLGHFTVRVCVATLAFPLQCLFPVDCGGTSLPALLEKTTIASSLQGQQFISGCSKMIEQDSLCYINSASSELTV